MKTILTQNDSPVIVDDNKYEDLVKYEWHLDEKGHVIRFDEHGKMRAMHRDIINTPENHVVKHANSVQNDMRAHSLFLCPEKYSRNIIFDTNPTKNKWCVFKYENGAKSIYGWCDTIEEAIKLADEKIKLKQYTVRNWNPRLKPIR